MKIYIDRLPKEGPWGGGAKTVNVLTNMLEERGHKVVNDLQEEIDIIFCFDPRPNHKGEWYKNFLEYRSLNPQTKIVQRVGDLGTHGKPELTKLVKETFAYSNFFIFPSKWSYEHSGFSFSNFKIINNAPMKIFYENRNTSSSISSHPRIITHHWSTNKRKGFDFYKKIEGLSLANGFSFHYVGQHPPEINFSNKERPMNVKKLSEHLPKFDIYLTASEEEAGANHVLEALAAGLPVIYRNNGGSIVNYCKDYGKEFHDVESCISSIKEVSENFSKYKEKVLSYNEDNISVARRYCEIIESL